MWAFHFSNAAVFISRMKRRVMGSAALASQQQNEVLPGGSRAGGIPFRICIYCVHTYVGGEHTVYSLRPRLHLCWYFSKRAFFFNYTNRAISPTRTEIFFFNRIFRDFCCPPLLAFVSIKSVWSFYNITAAWTFDIFQHSSQKFFLWTVHVKLIQKVLQHRKQ